MKNPFENVPLNTKKVFIKGTCKSGCNIYVPVDSFDIVEQNKKKEELQLYLNSIEETYYPESA